MLAWQNRERGHAEKEQLKNKKEVEARREVEREARGGEEVRGTNGYEKSKGAKTRSTLESDQDGEEKKAPPTADVRAFLSKVSVLSAPKEPSHHGSTSNLFS
jgi:hypothetical protein